MNQQQSLYYAFRLPVFFDFLLYFPQYHFGFHEDQRFTHHRGCFQLTANRPCSFRVSVIAFIVTTHGVRIETIRLSKPAAISPCAGTLRVLRTSWLWWREQELNQVPTLTQHSWTLTLRRETWTAWKRCVFIQFAAKTMPMQHMYVCIQWVFPFIKFADSGNSGEWWLQPDGQGLDAGHLHSGKGRTPAAHTRVDRALEAREGFCSRYARSNTPHNFTHHCCFQQLA